MWQNDKGGEHGLLAMRAEEHFTSYCAIVMGAYLYLNDRAAEPRTA